MVPTDPSGNGQNGVPNEDPSADPSADPNGSNPGPGSKPRPRRRKHINRSDAERKKAQRRAKRKHNRSLPQRAPDPADPASGGIGTPRGVGGRRTDELVAESRARNLQTRTRRASRHVTHAKLVACQKTAKHLEPLLERLARGGRATDNEGRKSADAFLRHWERLSEVPKEDQPAPEPPGANQHLHVHLGEEGWAEKVIHAIHANERAHGNPDGNGQDDSR